MKSCQIKKKKQRREFSKSKANQERSAQAYIFMSMEKVVCTPRLLCYSLCDRHCHFVILNKLNKIKTGKKWVEEVHHIVI